MGLFVPPFSGIEQVELLELNYDAFRFNSLLLLKILFYRECKVKFRSQVNKPERDACQKNTPQNISYKYRDLIYNKESFPGKIGEV